MNAKKDTEGSGKERLLASGLKLFSKLGYEATSIRMIAEDAGLSVANLAFHFGDKENFFKEVLRGAAQTSASGYQDITDIVQVAQLGTALNPGEAWAMLVRLVDKQARIAVSQSDSRYLSLLYWEQIQAVDECTPMSDWVFDNIERVLAYLIHQYDQSVDMDHALTISRIVNGGIMAYAHHPVFRKKLLAEMETRPTKTWVKEVLVEFSLNSIECYCAKDSQQGRAQHE